jgi:hypothetical protein
MGDLFPKVAHFLSPTLKTGAGVTILKANPIQVQFSFCRCLTWICHDNCPQCSWFCPWVVSHGGHPKHGWKTVMEIDDKIDIKHKSDYLKLVLKISKIRYQGDELSKELLQQTREMGRLAGISEQELENL